jgi:transcriptional regulator with XRE-family HTH domain
MAQSHKCITLDGVLKRLELRRHPQESQSKFCKRIGISQPILSLITRRKRPPNDVVLKWLGLRQVDHYYEVVEGK